MIPEKVTLVALLLAAVGLSGCGRDDNVIQSCDEPQIYQSVSKGEKVRAPAGLDDLEDYKEMPIPEATPRPERTPGSPCIDLPPSVLGTSKN